MSPEQVKQASVELTRLFTLSNETRPEYLAAMVIVSKWRADLVADAERRAVYRLLEEQGVRYRKHSALALEEDYDLASELFGVDFRAALQRGAL